MTGGGRVCTRCRVEKPAPEFYAVRKRGRESLSARCRECIRAAQNAARAARKETEGIHPDLRRCSRCLVLQPRDRFTAVGPKKRWRASWCHTCKRVHGKLWRETPEYRAWYESYARARRERPEVRERRNERERRRWREDRRHRARKQALRATPRYRLVDARRTTLRRLRRATDPARIARLEDLIRQYDAEIARLDSARGGPER